MSERGGNDNYMKHIILSMVFIFISLISFSQQMNPAKAGKLISSAIKDGVYFSFDDVKSNQPNLLLENLFKSYYDTSFTLSQWANTANLYYIDKKGNRKSLNRDSIWGYSENGIPFICINGFFHKINTIGAISVFTEFYPVIRDPLSIVVTDVMGTTADRILDFQNGRVGDYDLDNFNFILIRDEELFKEFNEIKKNKAKRKKMYSYLEKYNERHPMYSDENL